MVNYADALEKLNEHRIINTMLKVNLFMIELIQMIVYKIKQNLTPVEKTKEF